jgi:hypothetical protein
MELLLTLLPLHPRPASRHGHSHWSYWHQYFWNLQLTPAHSRAAAVPAIILTARLQMLLGLVTPAALRVGGTATGSNIVGTNTTGSSYT